MLVKENLLLGFQGTEPHPDGPEQKPPERENSWEGRVGGHVLDAVGLSPFQPG